MGVVSLELIYDESESSADGGLVRFTERCTGGGRLAEQLLLVWPEHLAPFAAGAVGLIMRHQNPTAGSERSWTPLETGLLYDDAAAATAGIVASELAHLHERVQALTGECEELQAEASHSRHRCRRCRYPPKSQPRQPLASTMQNASSTVSSGVTEVGEI